jgi:hypothetical protein
MPWSDFGRALKHLNGRLVLRESWGPTSMVYLWAPRDPDCNDDGYVEMIAVPTPRYHPSGLPVDDAAMVNGKWGRGVNTFFGWLGRAKWRGQRVCSPRAAKAYGSSKNYSEVRKELRERNWTEGYRSWMKYKHLFRPMAGNGDPVGAKASGKTLYF